MISPTVSAEDGGTTLFGTDVSDIQINLSVGTNAISGTLKKLTSGALVDTWGAGYFMALKFDRFDPYATSIKVGLDPSEGSGLVEIIDDPDRNGVFKVTSKGDQVFKVVVTNGTSTTTKTYSLKDLELEE